MQWDQPSSQQCLVDLGVTGPGVHAVEIEVVSERQGQNQVKVMGLYEQRLNANTSEAGEEEKEARESAV